MVIPTGHSQHSKNYQMAAQWSRWFRGTGGSLWQAEVLMDLVEDDAVSLERLDLVHILPAMEKI